MTTMSTLTTPSPASTRATADAASAATASATETGAVRHAPRALLRLEGAVVLLAALAAYAHLGGSWGWFAALFLVPDLTLLGYLAGPRVGAALYNAGHSYLAPALLAAVALAVTGPGVALSGALIWVAHIGFDRMAGYGLKYGGRFADTHLGVVGSSASITDASRRS